MQKYDHDQDANSKRFFLLAKKLDGIVYKYKNNFFAINNHQIFLSRNHPEYIKFWKPIIYRKKPTIFEVVQMLKMVVLGVFFFLKNVVTEINISKSKEQLTSIPIGQTNFLVISHYLGNEISDYDFYYGNLLVDLANLNKSVVRILIPHVNSGYEVSGSSQFDSIVLNKNLPNNLVFRYLFHNLKVIASIFCHTVFHKFTLYEILAILDGQLSNFSSIKISYNVELCLSRLKPDNVLMTFEGNAIERSIFFLCEKHNVTSFGYQHAPIIEDQYSIFRSLGKGLDPNVILASGPYTYNKFMLKLKNKIPIICLGSSKSTRAENNIVKQTNTSNILLIPDGNISSIDKFLQISEKLGRLQTSIDIILRVHPLFQDYVAQKISKNDFQIKKIVTLSRNNLSVDLKWAYWVIYQNSSVAIEALLEDCEVIHLKHELANIDPLFDLKGLNRLGQNIDELVDLVRRKNASAANENVKNRKFAANYFSPLDVKKLVEARLI